MKAFKENQIKVSVDCYFNTTLQISGAGRVSTLGMHSKFEDLIWRSSDCLGVERKTGVVCEAPSYD